MLINKTKFNLDFCRRFSPAKLRKIYNGESKETIDKLIEAVHGKSDEPTIETTVKVDPEKTKKKRSKK